MENLCILLNHHYPSEFICFSSGQSSWSSDVMSLTLLLMRSSPARSPINAARSSTPQEPQGSPKESCWAMTTYVIHLTRGFFPQQLADNRANCCALAVPSAHVDRALHQPPRAPHRCHPVSGGGGQLPASEPRRSPDGRHLGHHESWRSNVLCTARRSQSETLEHTYCTVASRVKSSVNYIYPSSFRAL